jgi:HEAT repeat protein
LSSSEGDEDVAAELRALADADSPALAEALRSLEARGAAVAPRLIEELALDRLGGVGRARILTLLARIGAPEGATPAIAAVDDPSPVVRATAIDAVAAFDDPRVEPTLLRLLGNPDADVVGQAAARLGDRRATGAVQRLGDLLFNPDQGVRYAAARALARVGTPEARDWLRAALARETDPEVRAIIEEAL